MCIQTVKTFSGCRGHCIDRFKVNKMRTVKVTCLEQLDYKLRSIGSYKVVWFPRLATIHIHVSHILFNVTRLIV